VRQEMKLNTPSRPASNSITSPSATTLESRTSYTSKMALETGAAIKAPAVTWEELRKEVKDVKIKTELTNQIRITLKQLQNLTVVSLLYLKIH